MSLLAQRAAATPTGIAVVGEGRALCWRELATLAERQRAAMAGAGLRPGDRIVLLAEPSLRLVALVHAARDAGLVLVPLGTRLSSGEIVTAACDAAPRLVVFDAGCSAPAEAAALACGADLRRLDSELEAEPSGPSPAVDAAAAATILYTSGTTGQPKGVVLTNRNHDAAAEASRLRLRSTGRDRWLLALPMHHIGGLSIPLRAAYDGAALVLHERFDPERAARALDDDGITLVSLVPTMLARMLPYLRRPPAVLRAALVGGGPLPDSVAVEAAERGVPLAPTYGMTETTAQVATAEPRAAAPEPGCCGLALPGLEVRVADADAEGYGEILVRGATVMQGYFGRPDETARALAGGWLHTGDVGRLDRAGRLFVAARRSDLILSGGENVRPAEVEAALLAHPAVADAGVYAREDREWGQVVAAAVVLHAGANASEQELLAWCRERLSRFKVPRTIGFETELPRTVSGKLRRFLLAERGRA